MCTFAVTSYAEVWIEIPIMMNSAVTSKSPPTRRCGLKSTYASALYIIESHLLRGGVDWNALSLKEEKLAGQVTSYAEVWIEIIFLTFTKSFRRCHLLRGGVDWNSGESKISIDTAWSPPTRRCGLKLPKLLLFGNPARSPPTRRCGLKYEVKKEGFVVVESPPTRRCGLK